MTDTQTPERIWIDPQGKGPNWPKKPVWLSQEYVRLDLHAAVVAERDQLKAAMKLAHDQYMGAGGNLKPQEIVDCMKIILKEALEENDG